MIRRRADNSGSGCAIGTGARACVLLFVVAAAAADASATLGVRLQTRQTTMPASGLPGFEILIQGWKPGGRFAIRGEDSTGKQVQIIPAEKGYTVSEKGIASFAVPYSIPGLHPGRWRLVVDGASGSHRALLWIPVTDPPGNGVLTWTIDFQRARERQAKADADVKHVGR